MIDETTAEKYFPDTDPVGKVIKLENLYEMTVSGVFKDIPKNSTYQFSIVLPWQFMNNYDWFDEEDWNSLNPIIFVLLDQKTDADLLNGKITNFMNDFDMEHRVDIFLQSFNDIHLQMEVNGPSAAFAFF